MVPTTITFEKDNVHPPVFVAGSFTDWNPTEMAYDSVKNIFSYKLELDPGKYQYKFRLGPGDWWVLDESAPTATDEHGNVNNVVSVEAQKPEPFTEPPIETIPTPPARVLNTRGAYIMADEPEVNGLADHGEPARSYPPPEEVVENLIPTQVIDQPGVDTEAPRPGNEKQVQFDERSGKITAQIVAPRKNSIPDIAPPPYSASANGTVPESDSEAHVAPVAEAPPQKEHTRPEAAESTSERKQQSFVARVCSGRGLVIVVAMVAVPVAVSYFVRR